MLTPQAATFIDRMNLAFALVVAPLTMFMSIKGSFDASMLRFIKWYLIATILITVSATVAIEKHANRQTDSRLTISRRRLTLVLLDNIFMIGTTSVFLMYALSK